MPSSDLAIPFLGYKSHISINRKFRFIRKWKKTDEEIKSLRQAWAKSSALRSFVCASNCPTCGETGTSAPHRKHYETDIADTSSVA